MRARTYEISIREFYLGVSAANELNIELNARKKILYLQNIALFCFINILSEDFDVFPKIFIQPFAEDF